MKRKFPPSLSKVPGLSNAELEEEKILKRLGQIMRGLAPQSGSSPDPEDKARYLYESFCIAKIAERQKQKGGRASVASVAKQLKGIASGATTLAKRLADRNVFEAWAGAAGADVSRVDHHLAKQEWLQLNSLLEMTIERATRAARTAEDVLKALPKGLVAARRGRPPDEIADAMTEIARGVYVEWTGKPTPRSISWDEGKPVGEFHQFLKDVFDALGMPSSPDASNMRLQTKLRATRK